MDFVLFLNRFGEDSLVEVCSKKEENKKNKRKAQNRKRKDLINLLKQSFTWIIYVLVFHKFRWRYLVQSIRMSLSLSLSL